MSSWFDDLAKGASKGMSRRDILRGALVGGFAAALGLFGAGKASADPDCQKICGAIYPPPRGKTSSDAFGKCVSACQACLHSGGRPCVPGACCNGNQTCCSGACVDLSSNNNNCGACGNVCPGGDTCCSGECANLSNDDNNCGSCGNVCPAGTSCVGGACVSNNNTSCGNCGNITPCSSDQSGTCYGFFTVDGGCNCFEDIACDGAQTCSSNADCPPGSQCTTGTCCGENICVPLCHSGSSAPALRQGGSGLTTSGAIY